SLSSAGLCGKKLQNLVAAGRAETAAEARALDCGGGIGKADGIGDVAALGDGEGEGAVENVAGGERIDGGDRGRAQLPQRLSLPPETALRPIGDCHETIEPSAEIGQRLLDARGTRNEKGGRRRKHRMAGNRGKRGNDLDRPRVGVENGNLSSLA